MSQTFDLNNLVAGVTEQLPETFQRQGQITLMEHSITEFRSHMKDNTGAPIRAAVSTGEMVLCEVTAFRQLPSNGDRAVSDANCSNYPLDAEERFWALEFLVAMPDFRLGQMVESTTETGTVRSFSPLAAYSDPVMQRWAEQTPVFYGQQMQANPTEVNRLHETLVGLNWSPITYGDGAQSPSSARRLRAWRLGKKVPEELLSGNSRVDYTRTLDYRVRHGLYVTALTATSSDPARVETNRGFDDFLSTFLRNLQDGIADERFAGPNPEEVKARHRDAWKLLSSVTGFRFDPQRLQRYPVRAGTPVLKLTGVAQEFNFWHSQQSASAAAAPAQPITPSDPAVPFDALS